MREGFFFMIQQIVKRDGRMAPFEIDKITNAIFGAAQASGGQDHDMAQELAEQVEQRTFLGVGTGVGRGSRLIEAAFITDADAPVVPPGCMCADLVDGTATVEIAVAGDIEMIADIGKSSRLV